MRVAFLFVPHFPVAVEARERPELRGQPVVIGGAPEERKAVVDCSPRAFREGVRRGMPLREALSRCPEGIFLVARHALYREVAAAMSLALDQVSPLFEPASGSTVLGRFFVGLDGLIGIHPDERSIANALVRAIVDATRLTPRVGVADGRFAAYASAVAATASHPRIIPPGKALDFLADLSVQHLPVSIEMQRRLRMLGIDRMGQLAALSPGAVQAQFGTEGRAAWNLIHGLDDSPVRPPERSTVLVDRISLPSPATTMQVLLAAARHLLTRLLARPECRYQVARRMDVRAILIDGQVWERSVTFREPRSALEPILDALRAKIADATFPAPVEAVEIALLDWSGQLGMPVPLLPTLQTQRQDRIEAAIRQIKAHYGRTLIARIVEAEPWSRIPERRFALIDYDV